MIRSVNLFVQILKLLFLFNCLCIPTTFGSDIQKCHPLSLKDGVVVCTPPNSEKSNSCQEEQEVGTIATYKCKPHFVFYNVAAANPSTNVTLRFTKTRFKDEVMKCGQNSKWIGYKKFQSYGCREDCGTRVTNAKPLIVNGIQTNATSWPWHAALFKITKNGPSYICGGTIIQKSVILTAAHCVSTAPGLKIQAESFLVVLGGTSHIFQQNKNTSDVQIIGVKKVYVSESYEPKKEFQADIAILQLNGTIEYSDSVSAVCLPNDFIQDLNSVKPGRFGDVVGFGIDENKNLSQSLKHAKLEIKPHSECFVKLQRTLSESQFCAGNLRGFRIDDKWITVCNGDSGGGWFHPYVTKEKFFIHGIVSTGDSNVRVGVCQNEAVFTRVFSFIDWIRNVLDEIGGSLALEFDSSFGIPFILKGKENLRVDLTPIPIEWKNQVTSVELSNVNIDPEILLDSLEYSKTVQHINFTRVTLKKGFSRRRVRLPHLKSISMDILIEDLTIFENRDFPPVLAKNFVPSVIFFDKDIEDEDVDVSRVAKLKVNIQITAHIFKLLDISQDFGKISISQSPLANDILTDLLKSDFKLKYLAVSRCAINSSTVHLLTQQSDTESLILDQVDLQGDQQATHLLSKMNRLQEFVQVNVISPYPVIYTNDIPKGLKHLALTNAILKFRNISSSSSDRIGTLSDRRTTPNPSALLFPDFKSETEANVENLIGTRFGTRETSELKTLFCDSCLDPRDSFEDSMRNLYSNFPKLKRLILTSPQSKSLLANSNLLKLLSNFEELGFAFLVMNDNSRYLRFSKRNGQLVQFELNQNSAKTYFERFEYSMSRKQNFWSSEADYVALTRLTIAEKIGFQTGHYKFDSGALPLPNGYFANNFENRFSRVPLKIQERLESMEISNVELMKGDLAATTESAMKLKRLILVNVSSPSIKDDQGATPWRSPLPKLEEYWLGATFVDAWSVLGYHGLASVFETLFHYIFPWDGEPEGFNVRKNFLQSRVNKIHVQHGECVGISWNAVDGHLTSGLSFTHEWLKNANENGIRIKRLAFKYWELDPAVVPSSVQEINLNFVILKNVPDLFEKLNSLKSLTFVNVRASDNNPADFKTWVAPIVDITHLADHHSKSLEYMAFEKINLTGYVPGITFERVETAYFESCSLEINFIKSFISVFPNLKRLAFAGGTSADGYLLLQAAAKLQSVHWILSTRDGFKSAKLRQRLKDLLGGQDLKESSSKYFIIQKNEATWIQIGMTEPQIKSVLDDLKGIKDFGRDPRCHANTFVGGVQRHQHITTMMIN